MQVLPVHPTHSASVCRICAVISDRLSDSSCRGRCWPQGRPRAAQPHPRAALSWHLLAVQQVTASCRFTACSHHTQSSAFLLIQRVTHDVMSHRTVLHTTWVSSALTFQLRTYNHLTNRLTNLYGICLDLSGMCINIDPLNSKRYARSHKQGGSTFLLILSL